MSILKRLIETEKTHNQRPLYAPLDAKMVLRKTGEVKPYQMDSNEEYVISLKVAVSFWANTAQRSSHAESAEKVLANELFHPIPHLLDRICKATMDNDQEEVFKLVNMIREEVAP